MALRVTMPAVLVFGFLHGVGVSPQPAENLPASANEFVRQVVANEIKAENQDHSHWAFRLQTEKAGRTEIDQVVETKDGNVQLPLSINGSPLNAKQKQQAKTHLKKLVHNPDALRRSLHEENEDTARTQNMLKLLPDAFMFSYDGSGAGDLVKLKFSPNPHFRPPSRDAQVFHAMEGEMTVDSKQQRLAEISGHLIHEVKFGGGFLGHLDKGGQFSVKQEQVSPGFWELSALNVHMQGKALFFKTISVQQKMLRSGFRRVSDDLTVAQAADMLGESTLDSADAAAGASSNAFVPRSASGIQ
jgi:hypothetical protein